MKKIALGVLAFVLFLGTNVVFAQAQVGDMDPLGTSKTCINLTNDLRLTSKDTLTNGQVSDLQFFLQSKGYLNFEPTGYFGLITQNAVIQYQNRKNILPASGFVGSVTRTIINKESCSTNYASSEPKKIPISQNKDSKIPSLSLIAKSDGNKFTSSITVVKGSKIEFSGKPIGLKGLKNSANGFTASWSFGTIFDNNCSNNQLKSSGTWKMKCTANTVGSTDMYVNIFKDGKTYSSNKINVVVLEKSDKGSDGPMVYMIRGKAVRDFEIIPGELIGIEGDNLIYAGKDTEVYVGGKRAVVKQYDSKIVYFTAPQLDPGNYDLYVTTSFGTSEPVHVKVYQY